MEMLLGLIESLKLNNTIVAQFIIFLIGYSILYYLLFKPYNRAAQARYDRTVGSEQSANKYDEEIELLKRKYGEKVKQTNAAVKNIFTEYEEKAKKDSSKMALEAQEKNRNEKQAKENQVNDQYQDELKKVPQLASDVKEELKKVLVGI